MALTEKQETFCRNIISGMSGKDSYISAYNSKGSEQNAYNEASKLLARDDIQERLKVLRKPLEMAAQTIAISEREKKKAIIWERIQACIANNDDTSVARYMDILNKMDAEYININRTITDNDTDIKELDTDKLIRLVDTA
jgi:phage terminase small subunit